MTMHLQRSNDGFDYEWLEQQPVILDRCVVSTPNWQLAETTKSFMTTFGHQRTQTLVSISPSSQCHHLVLLYLRSPSRMHTCVCAIQSLHPSSGLTCGDTVPVGCYMYVDYDMALVAITLLCKNVISVQVMQNLATGDAKAWQHSLRGRLFREVSKYTCTATRLVGTLQPWYKY